MVSEEHVHPAVWVSSSYENVRALCPWCSVESIFNRRTDLEDIAPIANRTVSCLSERCGKRFVIIGDSVNQAFEMMIWDTYDLLDRKHYMAGVLNLAQAHEMFFIAWLRCHLCLRPYATNLAQGLGKLNETVDALYEATRKLGFVKLRAVFLQLVKRGAPTDLDSARAEIAKLEEWTNEPSNSEIAHSDQAVRALLLRVKDSRVNELRNRVVHGNAYRPSRTEVEDALEETRSTLFPLATNLGVQEDVNWHIARARTV